MAVKEENVKVDKLPQRAVSRDSKTAKRSILLLFSLIKLILKGRETSFYSRRFVAFTRSSLSLPGNWL